MQRFIHHNDNYKLIKEAIPKDIDNVLIFNSGNKLLTDV